MLYLGILIGLVLGLATPPLMRGLVNSDTWSLLMAVLRPAPAKPHEAEEASQAKAKAKSA